MYKKILKECGANTTILIVDEDCKYRALLGEKYLKYFKKIIYAPNSNEALPLYKDEKFDIVILDIDKESVNGLDLIHRIQRIDLNQSIFVYSEQTENFSLIIDLLNLGVECFIEKSKQLESYIKIFAQVTKKNCERKMLMLYLDELERAQIELLATQNTVVQEDDFDFFPTTIPNTEATINTSLYKDYFNLLDNDDKEDLYDLLTDIDTTLINAFTDTGANSEYITKLGSLLIHYGNVLMSYQFFSDMGMAILEFGQDISNMSQKVAEQADIFHSLISGFCSGLQVFLTEVWEKDSDNPKYFNDSIINDARLISEMIIPPVVTNNEDDLVFF